MSESIFEPLEQLLEEHFDGPFDSQPNALRERVTEAFYPLQWDELAPSGRRSLARQADARDAPSMQEQNDFFWQEAVQVSEVEQAINEWDLMRPQNVAEKLAKDSKLDELKARLSRLQALSGMPAFQVTNWQTLTTRLTPEPQTAAAVLADAATVRETLQTINAPKFSMPRGALVAAHEHEWSTIRRDIADASTNGLAAAKAGAREWHEATAMEWARAKGKLESAAKPASVLAQALNSMANVPGRKHKLEG